MTFDILPFPPSQELIIDPFHMASKRHIVRGFMEVDVTVPRRISKEHPAPSYKRHRLPAAALS